MPDMDRFWEIFLNAFAGMFGGLANFLYRKDKKKFKPIELFTALLLSAFFGWCFGDFFRWVGAPEQIIRALSGMCGFMGPTYLVPTIITILEKFGFKSLSDDKVNKQ